LKVKTLCLIIILILISSVLGGSLSFPANKEKKSNFFTQPENIENAKPRQLPHLNPHLSGELPCYVRIPYPPGLFNESKNKKPGFDNPGQGEENSHSILLRINPGQQQYGEILYSPFTYQRSYISDLGINLDNVDYYENITVIFNLTDDMISKLSNNGFIVVNNTVFNEYNPPKTSFVGAYQNYWHKDLPIIITTDTILNTFHLLFDQMLKDIEKGPLYWRIEMMSELLMNDSHASYTSLEEGILKDISKHASVFFAVATYLMDDTTEIPITIQEDVNYYVEKILNATEVVLEYNYEGRQFYVDYTQYKPRGHYAGDELLEKYFRCMKWYGRKSLDMNLSNDIKEAVIIAKLMEDNPEAKQLWYDVYNITRFLVGASDSLSFKDIKDAVLNSVGELSIDILNSDQNVVLIRDELQKPEYISQRILSTVVVKPPWQAFEQMDFPKIFQFMGERYVPDSEVMQNVIYDRVPLYEGKRRGLANGLDVMASLGSYRAVEHLEGEFEYYNYTSYLEYSYNLMNNMTDGFWNETTYSGWLNSYTTLVSDTKNNTQPFMQTKAWADEKLNSVLGSWAELRHDTILYAKQPYSVSIKCSTPDAWVEPYPMFFQKIAALSNRTIEVLKENLPNGLITQRFIQVFSDFERINTNLSVISEKELRFEELTKDEKDFLKSIFRIEYVGCGQKVKYGWLPELLRDADVEEKTLDARIIADVNTDPGSQTPPMPPKVLHVASGYVETLIVLYEKPDGNYTFAVGPVYSYYEFPVDGFTRFTDDEWKDRLGSKVQKRPFWTSSFLVNEDECLINVYE
jgi:hypothetical protein